MIVIHSDSCGKGWLKYMDAVVKNGALIKDGDVDIIEANSVCIIFSKLSQHDPIILSKGNATLIKLYSDKMFTTYKLPEFSVSYGKRLFDHFGVNLIQKLMNLLREKPETKSAAISLLQPNDHLGATPCLCLIQVKLRQGRFHMTCYFRSQNAYRSYANFTAIAKLQEIISQETDKIFDSTTIIANCPHIYKKDLNKVLEILEADNG